MFETGKYYLCIKTRNVNSASINDFIDTVFGNSKRISEFNCYWGLNAKTSAYKENSKSVGYSELAKELVNIKKQQEYEWLDEYYDDYNDSLGVFSKNRIYHCPINNALIDDKGNVIFFIDYCDYVFEEVEFDTSDVNDILSKFDSPKSGLATLAPYVKMGGKIIYKCQITIFGKVNKGVAVSMSSDKAYAIALAYKEARKNLLCKTRLFHSICGFNV